MTLVSLPNPQNQRTTDYVEMLDELKRLFDEQTVTNLVIVVHSIEGGTTLLLRTDSTLVGIGLLEHAKYLVQAEADVHITPLGEPS